MRHALIISLALAALSAVACTTTAGDEAIEAPVTEDGAENELRARVIGEKDHGKTIEVALGQSFTVALPENATTGFQWKVSSVDRTLGAPKETSVPGTPQAIGSGGTKAFTWTTKSALNLEGKHEIGFEYRRPFETGGAPEKTFKVTVDIKKVAVAVAACGGRLNLTCEDGEYCAYKISDQCGATDKTGRCEKKPDACAEIFIPVCGCDGKTYGNSCDANMSGVSVVKEGACAASE